VERAGLLGGVTLRAVAAGPDFRMRGDALREAILEDRKAGFIPFYVRFYKKLRKNM
jgi:hypothetical protein